MFIYTFRFYKADLLQHFNGKSNPISPLLLYSVFAMGTKFDDINVHLDPIKSETARYAYYNRARGKKRFCVTISKDFLKVLFTNDYYYPFYRSIR